MNSHGQGRESCHMFTSIWGLNSNPRTKRSLHITMLSIRETENEINDRMPRFRDFHWYLFGITMNRDEIYPRDLFIRGWIYVLRATLLLLTSVNPSETMNDDDPPNTRPAGLL